MSDEKFFKPFRHPIQRLTVSEKDGEHSVRRFAKHASSLASEHLRTMAPEGIDKTKTHLDAAKLWGAFRTEDEFRQHESQWLRSFFECQQRFLDLTFPLGDYILAALTGHVVTAGGAAAQICLGPAVDGGDKMCQTAA
jgi:hypothetical protein